MRVSGALFTHCRHRRRLAPHFASVPLALRTCAVLITLSLSLSLLPLLLVLLLQFKANVAAIHSEFAALLATEEQWGRNWAQLAGRLQED